MKKGLTWVQLFAGAIIMVVLVVVVKFFLIVLEVMRVHPS